MQAQGDYFAYCDQDDVWLPEKLTALLAARVPGKDALVCSDMSLIDQDGETVARSVFKGGRRAASRRAETTAEQLLVRNWVTGCTTLLPAAVAKQAVPFCPYMVHDHYLAFWCARGDGILCVEKPLIRHRVQFADMWIDDDNACPASARNLGQSGCRINRAGGADHQHQLAMLCRLLRLGPGLGRQRLAKPHHRRAQ